MGLSAGASLGRLIQRSGSAAAATEERCELCDAPLPVEHRHVLDLAAEELRCVCQACGLLFEREAAGRGHYRLVPRRRIRLGDEDVPTGVPVGLAFLVRREDDTVVARYPSPIGTTSAGVDSATWAALTGRWPQLGDLVPDVEALLIHTGRGHHEHWIVPVDDCYRLIALVQQHWTGFSGGREVWQAIDEYFDRLGAPPRGRIEVGSE